MFVDFEVGVVVPKSSGYDICVRVGIVTWPPPSEYMN